MESISNVAVGSRSNKKCDICSRSFARSEHLARHRRTHTKEKPFPCPYCRRSFQRSDVKAAHVKKCHATPPEDCDTEAGRGDSSRKRVRIACHSCRKRKMRCDGNLPCAPCHSSSSICQYTTATASPNTDRSLHAQSISGELPSHAVNELNVTTDEDVPHRPPLQSSIQHSSSDNISFLNDGTACNHDAFNLDVQRESTMAVYGSTTYDAPDLSLSNEDVLYPLPEVSERVDFWQIPPIDGQFWFDGSDFDWSDGIFDSNSPLSNHVFSSSMQNLTATMQEYFDRKSRAPSPSLNKASKMWYSAPPNMEDHNKDIVRIFLNIFRRHIPDTFSLFKDSIPNRHKTAAYTLAMAATGGLFCSVPGSAEVAKSMYNDARRLLLASFYVRNSSGGSLTSPQDKLVTAKTFILLGLYGLCSGDKRCYEFVEAFHGGLMVSVQEYSHACKTAESESECEQDNVRLLETLHILDCYRAIIMQRPPSLSWNHTESFAQSPPPESRMYHLYEFFSELTDRGVMLDANWSDEFRLSSLARLCSYLWPATYSQQHRSMVDDNLSKSPAFWDSDFVELACDNWLRTVGQKSNSSTLVIYHMMNIMLHADLTMLQHFAHSAPGSPTRDVKKSLVAREIQAWKQSRHFKIAHWHAEGIIGSVERAFSASSNRAEQQHLLRSNSTVAEQRRLPHEAPHIPYAIYYATLVTWGGAVTEENIASQPSTAQGFVARGERILSLHKVHIAQLLARVLNEVK